MRAQRRVIAALTAAAALLLTSCVSSDADPVQTTAPPEPSASSPAPSSPPAEAFEFPEPGDADEAAFFRAPGRGEGETAEIIAGPSSLVADRAVRVEGQCEGSSAPFEVVASNTDSAGTVLIEGTLQCDDPRALSEFAYSMPYEGVVQIMLTNTDRIEQGWIRVTQD